jgi:hypothetical protein
VAPKGSSPVTGRNANSEKTGSRSRKVMNTDSLTFLSHRDKLRGHPEFPSPSLETARATRFC